MRTLRRTIAACLVLLPLVSGCTRGPALPASALHDLATLAQLREAFNAGAGRPRLILLLSPT